MYISSASEFVAVKGLIICGDQCDDRDSVAYIIYCIVLNYQGAQFLQLSHVRLRL